MKLNSIIVALEAQAMLVHTTTCPRGISTYILIFVWACRTLRKSVYLQQDMAPYIIIYRYQFVKYKRQGKIKFINCLQHLSSLSRTEYLFNRYFCDRIRPEYLSSYSWRSNMFKSLSRLGAEAGFWVVGAKNTFNRYIPKKNSKEKL